jgi:hypothetical protein
VRRLVSGCSGSGKLRVGVEDVRVEAVGVCKDDADDAVCGWLVLRECDFGGGVPVMMGHVRGARRWTGRRAEVVEVGAGLGDISARLDLRDGEEKNWRTGSRSAVMVEVLRWNRSEKTWMVDQKSPSPSRLVGRLFDCWRTFHCRGADIDFQKKSTVYFTMDSPRRLAKASGKQN